MMPLERGGGILGRLLPGGLLARLVLGTAILLGTIATFLVVYIPVRLERHTLDLTARRAASIAELTAHSITAALVFEDHQAIQEVFSGARRNLDVHYLVLSGPTGRVVAAHNLPEAESDAYALTGPGRGPGVGNVLKVQVPVGPVDHPVGTLYLGLDLTAVRANVAATRQNVVVVTLGLFLLGGLGFAGMSSLVTRPVRRIVQTMEGVSAGDLSLRTGLVARDEMGYLGASFDSMVARLETAYSDMKAQNEDLEARVIQRTHALTVEIEERQRAEGALRESERRFRAMFESSVVGIALLAPDGMLLGTNASLREMLGLGHEASGASPGGTNPMDALVHPADRQLWKRARVPVRGGGAAPAVEIRWKRADGLYVWSRVVVSEVVQDEGSPLLGMMMVEDVTERRALEEQLLQSQKLEAVGQLAGGVAHDFNNLLTTINGMTDLLVAEYQHLPALRDDLMEIGRAGKYAAGLTSQLLAFSRRQQLQPEELDPVRAIQDMGSMLERLIGPTIHMRMDLAPGTWGIRADPGQIAQVIMNLVVNARDAMPSGGTFTVRTRNVILDAEEGPGGTSRSGPFVELTCSDTGQGMDEATRLRVFEPFFTTKPRGKGTGLGLSTVHGIVHQSGGRISVDSETGAGTTFTVLLPALPAVHPEASPPRDVRELDGKGLILLVEDEPAVRRVVGRFLRRSGYSVLEGVDGRDGMEIFEKHRDRIAAVVTDVIMPNMRGPEMVRQIAEMTPGVPVLYISGYTEDEALDAMREGGRYAFLQKPLAPLDVTSRLQELLERESDPGPGPGGPDLPGGGPAAGEGPPPGGPSIGAAAAVDQGRGAVLSGSSRFPRREGRAA